MVRPSSLSTLVAFALSAILWLVPRGAAAQSAGLSLHVLDIDTDDSDEQADALTNALRSQVRSTPGWTLLETTQSLSMLTAAFQCPQRPDPACLVRIAKKLKTDQFLWGIMTKAPGHQVTADVHVWTRGKPDKATRQTFSDNLRDENDDALKKVALQIFSALFGGTGTLIVHANSDTGTVVIDGNGKTPLDHGRATLSLPAGLHTVELDAPGFLTFKRQVAVEPSGSVPLEVTLEVDSASALNSAGKPLPVRAILGWTGVGAGAILVGVGIGFGVAWLNDKSDLDSKRGGYGTNVSNPCSGASTLPAVDACNDVNAAHSAITSEAVTLSIGGALALAGVYLLVTNHPSEAGNKPATGWNSLQWSPSFGPGGGSMAVLGRF